MIGGGQVYAEFLPMADRMELTLVDANPVGDAWFPEWDGASWRLAASSVPEPGHDPAYEFRTLERKAR